MHFQTIWEVKNFIQNYSLINLKPAGKYNKLSQNVNYCSSFNSLQFFFILVSLDDAYSRWFHPTCQQMRQTKNSRGHVPDLKKYWYIKNANFHGLLTFLAQFPFNIFVLNHLQHNIRETYRISGTKKASLPVNHRFFGATTVHG